MGARARDLGVRGAIYFLCTLNGIDVIAQIPREQIFKLRTTFPILRLEGPRAKMCKLTYLYLFQADLSSWFVEPDVCRPHTFQDLLRGLGHISLTQHTLSGGDWRPLINFLFRRAAVGNTTSSLSLRDRLYMDENVVESIERAVEVFEGRHRTNALAEGVDYYFHS